MSTSLDNRGEIIPCSVNILTLNSGDSLAKTLASVSRFAEVVIADGGSTDATLDIARQFGCKVITQDPSFLNAHGRIIDFSAVRNQNATASSEDWIFRIDSDDWATQELVDQIEEACNRQDGPNCYSVRAIYEMDGDLIKCAASYPMHFVRLFRTQDATHYGAVNENIRTDGDVGALDGAFVIPIQPLRRVLVKWWHYVRVDIREFRTLDHDSRNPYLRTARSAVRWFATRWLSTRRECTGRRLPARYEFARLVYLSSRFLLLWLTFHLEGAQMYVKDFRLARSTYRR